MDLTTKTFQTDELKSTDFGEITHEFSNAENAKTDKPPTTEQIWLALLKCKNCDEKIDKHSNVCYKKCQYCGYLYLNEQCFKMHLVNHESYTCIECNLTCYEKNWLRDHRLVNYWPPIFPCYFCGKTFTKIQPLIKHQTEDHDFKGLLKCHECNKTFYLKDHQKFHKQTIHTEMYYECEICGEMI